MAAFKETILFQSKHQQTVPDGLVGVWRRLSLEENGTRDTTTQVYWLQTSQCFGDIRIPADRPAVGSFENLSAQQAIALNQQDGFVGVTQLDGDLCRWHHAMDYLPAQAQVADTGKLSWEGDILVEVGPEGSYVEKWQRIATGATAAMTCSDESGWRCWLVVCGDRFIYMHNPYTGNHFQSSLNREISMGRIQRGSLPWEIQLSTLPWKEGCSLWRTDAVTVDPTRQRLIQKTNSETLHWTVREWGDRMQTRTLF